MIKYLYLIISISLCWTQWYQLNHDFIARSYYMSYPENISDQEVIRSIQKESYKISREFSKNLDLRFTPSLDFKIDTLNSDSQKVENILDHIKKNKPNARKEN